MSTAPTSSEKFSYAQSLKTGLLLIAMEGFMVFLTNIAFPHTYITWVSILFMAFVGAFAVVILSTEVISETRDNLYMHLLFVLTIVQFIVFFAYQYWLFSLVVPNSFTVGADALPLDAVSLIYQSTMIFVFNPLMSPHGGGAELLLLINVLGAMGIVLFVLQNLPRLHMARQESR